MFSVGMGDGGCGVRVNWTCSLLMGFPYVSDVVFKLIQ